MVYCSYFHSIMSYGIIFWGNSGHSNLIFGLQKKAVRIMMGLRCRESCRKHFKGLNILTLKSQYIVSLCLFVINSRHRFEANSEMNNVKTRTRHDLHYPRSQLSVFQKGVYYTGIKVFNGLPVSIKELSTHTQQFKQELKNFLFCHSVYTLDEYFNFKN
jgi:hypothetical protein